MAEYLIKGESLVAIADEVRELSGKTEAMGTNAMVDTLRTENSNFNINLNAQDDLLAQIEAALKGKAAGGAVSLQEKTVTPTTSQQSMTPDSGYDGLSKVTVNAMPMATQATPSISVNSSGLITASATQSAGYVSSGTKSATKQLTTQAAKTVTPTTSNQTAVASGRYTTGAITVKGDANLKAENIKSGVSIFGVDGTYEGSGGSSGGGGGFEDNTDVCSVVYTSDYAFNTILYYGPDGYSIVGDSHNITITAICGSVISVAQAGFYSANVSAGEVICSRSGLGLVYRVPSTPTSVTINVTTG